MAVLVLYLLAAGLLAVGLTLLAVVTLARGLGGRSWPLAAAGVLLVLGTVPPTVLGVLWYARSADYGWAIRGPGVFAQLGGGPAMLAAFVFAIVWTVACWVASLRLAARAVTRD